MDEVTALCRGAKTFPLNFNQPSASPYHQRLYQTLNEHTPRLFLSGETSALDFLELSARGKDFWPKRVTTEGQLSTHLGLNTASTSPDPRCRFLFVQAINGISREKLQTTRETLMLCFTYFRVMPEFLDFLFSFGYQARAQDPYFGSFRQRTCLSSPSQYSSVQELAWSGVEISTCYNLRSPERSGSGPNDWSIRLCAVHHTLDLKKVRSNWIVIKGNDVLKDRVEQATCDNSGTGVSLFDTLDRAFAGSLTTHLIFCDWAVEQWRWYINSLDEQFQNSSRRTLTAPVIFLSRSPGAKDDFAMPPRTETAFSNRSILGNLSRAQTMLVEKLSVRSTKPKTRTERISSDLESGLRQPLPPHITAINSPDSAPQSPQQSSERAEEQDFSFSKLQKVQHIEEKAHEALLAMRLNTGVIRQLKEHYNTVVKLRRFPQDIYQRCQDDLEQFELRINDILGGLEMQIIRLESLIRLLQDRKTLVTSIVQSIQNARLRHDQLQSILEYYNTEYNKQSTKNMMSMTDDMNDIARKTKIETVSMKVITVVTLFFLPGTFISTLMSTDIFQSGDQKLGGPDPYAHYSPLQIYLIASLPLTLVTILIWAALHWLEKHEENFKALKAQAHRLKPSLMV